MNKIPKRTLVAVAGLALLAWGFFLLFLTGPFSLTILWVDNKPNPKNIYSENSFINLPGVYEPLVSIDSYLSPVGILADSWGKVQSQQENTKWKFLLKQSISYSDGTNVTNADIEASLNKIPGTKCSFEDTGLYCTTSLKDSLFLRKISLSPVTQNGSGAGPGTGPYTIIKDTGSEIYLTRNQKFREDKAGYKADNLKYIYTSFVSRAQDLIKQGIPDLVINPFKIDGNIQGYSNIQVPSLETYFLLPKYSKISDIPGNFDTRNYLRHLLTKSLESDKLADSLRITNTFFASNLVPDLSITFPDIKSTETISPLNMYVLAGLEPISLYLKDVTKSVVHITNIIRNEAGIKTAISSAKETGGLILAGWDFENAGIDGFISDIIIPHCTSWLNVSEKDVCLDLAKKISSEENIYSKELNKQHLQSLELFLTSKLVIIPLFETKHSVIMSNRIKYTPNPLGDIHLDGISKNYFNF